MATYLKRTSKLFDLSLSHTSTEVNLRDLICPVCRGILIEPVTLPCTHNLCLRCLKGTFEHNSLSCPLCRVRVGSWLRTATKSETLVNSALWELIRTRFPKEIEGKQNGDEGDIELDSGFASKKVILSAAGEIRREYQVQLKIAEEEIRRQRESEILANEALIRKIHAEEQKEKLAQLAKDQLLAKSLAEKNLSKDKSAMRYYTEYGSANLSKKNDDNDLRARTMTGNKNSSNPQNSDQRTERTNDGTADCQSDGKKYAGTAKIRSDKICQKTSNPMQNVVTKTIKQVGKYVNSNATNFISEPSCSGTQIYGTRSKEELNVPIDLLSSKKKIVGVEVCVTTDDDDERIGSAESAGSHDSINQEIHHFKPIKPIARTALKISADGRPIDPKLLRVIPIIKRVANAVPKPPTPTHFKRMLGCSWSAFRGKARQNLEMRRASASKSDTDEDVKISMVPLGQISVKTAKAQLSESSRRLDLPAVISFDTNKNYAKGINRLLNGTRVSKKLILESEKESEGIEEMGNATYFPDDGKNVKPNKSTSVGRKRNYASEKKRESVEEESSSRSCSPMSYENSCEKMENKVEMMVNIAERIKKRKIVNATEKLSTSHLDNVVQRKTRKNSRSNEKNDNAENLTSKSEETVVKLSSTRTIRRRNESSVKRDSSIDSSLDRNVEKTATRNKRNTRKSMKRKIFTKISKNNSRDDDDEEEEEDEEENEEREEKFDSHRKTNCDTSLIDNIQDEDNERENNIDEEIIEEQQRMERLILQEKRDFELAMRLQSQFDDMERIANRTRGSRRAMDNLSIEDLVEFGDNGGKRNTRESRRIKQRRRPQKHAVK